MKSNARIRQCRSVGELFEADGSALVSHNDLDRVLLTHQGAVVLEP